jgi:CheY-like chemotaxis protein
MMSWVSRMTPAILKARRILVVDDEPQVCQAIEMLLRFDKHEVVVVNAAAAALAELSKTPFDLVFLDYLMPGMKGDELARLIKAKDPTQPVAMITAYAEVLRGSRSLLSAVDCLLSKPFLLSDLRQTIEVYARPDGVASPTPETPSAGN